MYFFALAISSSENGYSFQSCWCAKSQLTSTTSCKDAGCTLTMVLCSLLFFILFEFCGTKVWQGLRGVRRICPVLSAFKSLCVFMFGFGRLCSVYTENKKAYLLVCFSCFEMVAHLHGAEKISW